MSGFIVLEGGAEFQGKMSEPDLRAIELAGGSDALICIIPTAAAPDNNHQRAGRHGANWFKSLGAINVQVLPIIDRGSANDPAIVATLHQARLIYLLGGFTGYLGQTLKGSAGWQAMLEAYELGAVLAGSSAGAMVLCQYYFDPATKAVVEGLSLVQRACVIPHHNTFGKQWVPQLTRLLSNVTLLGIDEGTGMIDSISSHQPTESWQVYGRGGVTLYQEGIPTTYQSGATFSLPQKPMSFLR